MYTIIISEKSPVCTSECSCENARMYDFVGKSMQSELWQVYKTIRSYHLIRICRKPGRKRPSRNYPRPETYVWVQCTINRSHSTPCKNAEFEHLQIFPGHCLDFFLSVSGKICHSPIKKVKRKPTLIISFFQHSLFFGKQSKNPG